MTFAQFWRRIHRTDDLFVSFSGQNKQHDLAAVPEDEIWRELGVLQTPQEWRANPTFGTPLILHPGAQARVDQLLAEIRERGERKKRESTP